MVPTQPFLCMSESDVILFVGQLGFWTRMLWDIFSRVQQFLFSTIWSLLNRLHQINWICYWRCSCYSGWFTGDICFLSLICNVVYIYKSSLKKEHPWRWITEHVIFPAFRTELIPPRQMAEDGSVLQIADLHDLYKVFERCWMKQYIPYF